VGTLDLGTALDLGAALDPDAALAPGAALDFDGVLTDRCAWSCCA
jgi:hypothetical protein